MPSPSVTRRVATPPTGQPLLIYDGDCGFCHFWAERIRLQSGGRIALAASQELGGRFPEITPEDYAQAVWLVEPDGRLCGGATAIFRALALAGSPAGEWCQAHVPGFAALTNFGYGLVARHRPVFSKATRWIWGRDFTPPSFAFSTWLFLRLLGLVYLIAFVSFWVQLDGLVGPDGILPASEFLALVKNARGPAAYWLCPTLAWLGGAHLLPWICGAGTVAAGLLLAGIAPGPCVLALWAGYLSLCSVGQDFLGFQWDSLLLEAGLIALFVAPWRVCTWRARDEPPALGRFLLWFLLFKLMFLSGLVKLTSGDPNWTNLQALRFHYETQPLPTWIGWWAHQLPGWFQAFSCLLVFVVELPLPFLLFAPRRLRHFAAGAQILLQVLLGLTGNYTFFNLLTIALCVPFLDDTFWPRRWVGREYSPPPPRRVSPTTTLLRAGTAAVILGVSANQILGGFSPVAELRSPLYPVERAVDPLRSINSYGLFRVMTTRRVEIVVEGSRDGLTWESYEFNWKPGALDRRPGFVEPHQPRLDWQMWFAVFGRPQDNPWFLAFVVRLLEGSPAVTHLLAYNPFPGQPPRYIRARLYDYHFTTRAERAKTGQWWRRDLVGFYLPATSLR